VIRGNTPHPCPLLEERGMFEGIGGDSSFKIETR